MPELTVVIPFLNEREQVDLTLRSIRETVEGGVDVILVNDGSEPDYDYQAVADRWGARLIVHPVRLGVDLARQTGVTEAVTQFVFAVDAHIEFYTHDWHRRLVQTLTEHPKAIVAPAVQGLRQDRTPVRGYELWGAIPTLSALEPDRFLNLKAFRWGSRKDYQTGAPTIGGFGARRDWWLDLHAADGLWLWGASASECSFSIRSIMAGGEVILAGDVVMGCVLRDAAHRPYSTAAVEILRNKLFVLQTLFHPARVKIELDRLAGLPEFAEAAALIRADELEWARGRVARSRSFDDVERYFDSVYQNLMFRL
jgi:glycosyltransferase involved in cell wall biosynthesis